MMEIERPSYWVHLYGRRMQMKYIRNELVLIQILEICSSSRTRYREVVFFKMWPLKTFEFETPVFWWRPVIVLLIKNLLFRVQSCRKINIKKNNIHKLSLPQTRERDKKKMVKIKLKRSCFRRNLNFFHSKKLLLDKNKFIYIRYFLRPKKCCTSLWR